MAEFFFKTAPGQPAFSEEVCTQAFEPSRPYPQNPLAIIYRARFKQLRAYYTKPVPNTPHPNLPQVYFVDDVDFQDKMAGLIEWTRIYSTCPTSWNDFASTAYTFPGLSGIRVPVSKTVTEKIVQDYFLVGTLPNFTANVSAYDDFANAAWTKGGVTGTANSTNVAACAGQTLTAAKIAEDTSSGQHYVDQASTSPAGMVFGTVFLKAAERAKAEIYLNDNFAFARMKVDLTNGTASALAGFETNTNFTVAAIDGGWWRVGIQGNAGNASCRLLVLMANSSGNTTYQGVSGSGMYMWRGQLVSGNTVPHATVTPTVTPDGSNYPVPNADNIAVKFGLQYVYQWSQNVAAEYLDGSTAPNINTWNGWVSADAANGNSNSYSVESADSTLSLWQGSIWQRQRHYVKAR